MTKAKRRGEAIRTGVPLVRGCAMVRIAWVYQFVDW